MTLYITLSETKEELRDSAASHSWDLGPEIAIVELVPPESLYEESQQQSLLYTSDLELGESTRAIFASVEAEKPVCIVLDSVSEIRLLAGGSLRYLNRQGAATFLTVAQHGLVGDMQTPVDVIYLADTVVLLRYFEALGRIRRAISVVKKRAGAHEDTIREYRISRTGLTIGDPLVGFEGVLRGAPTYVGRPGELTRLSRDDER